MVVMLLQTLFECCIS